MKTQQARQSLRQQTFHYCDIKHLVTGSNEKRLAVELSTADIVPCKNPLMPVNEREVQSGKFKFHVNDPIQIHTPTVCSIFFLLGQIQML